MQTKTVIFIGPQGSGKGTQVAKVLKHLKAADSSPVVHLETGHGFRVMKESDSYTGQQVRKLLEHGKMVPNFLTSSIVMSEIAEQITKDSDLVIDGFPRNLDQARVLDQMMEFYERDNLIVIHLNVPEEVVIKRMTGRGREDDTPELIAERLRLYHQNTTPLIEYYEKRPQTTFVEIDGTQSIDEVWNTIKTAIAA